VNGPVDAGDGNVTLATTARADQLALAPVGYKAEGTVTLDDLRIQIGLEDGGVHHGEPS